MEEAIACMDRKIHVKTLEDFQKWSKLFLRGCVSWPEDSQLWKKVLYWYNLTIGITIIIWQHFYMAQHMGNFDIMIGCHATMLAVEQCSLKTFIMWCRKPIFQKLLTEIRDEFWPLDLFEEEFPGVQKLLKVINIILVSNAMLCAFIVASWMIFPYVKLEEGMRKMPILSWYPYDVNKAPYYQISYIIITYCGQNCTYGIMGYDMLWGYIMTQLCLQYRLLSRKLRLINVNGSETSEEQSYKDLIFCIKYHLKLARFCDDVRTIYQIGISMSLPFMTLAICIMFVLMGNEPDIMRRYKVAGYWLIIVTQLAVYSVFGGYLEHSSFGVSQGAYESGWYFSPKSRLGKGMIHVMQIAQNPQRITANGLAYINNETFVSVLKTSFSAATLLQDLLLGK